MKLLKISKVTCLLLVLVLFGFACGDFLVLGPHQSISDDAMLKTIGDFRSSIIGGYDQLQGDEWYGRTMPLVPDIMGEDVKQNGSANRYQEFADYEGLPQSGHAYENDMWDELYETIDLVNKMINAEFTPLAASKIEFDQIIGEAHAVRALAHFDLVRMFAQHYTFTAGASHLGVPIVLVSDYTVLPSRNTVAEVYTQVIADFTTAISLMTMTREGSYMLTKEACQALLSRVYLYMEDFTNAVTMADAVINSGKYSLVSAAKYVTQFSDGGSSEAIFEIWNATDDRQGSDSVGGMYRASGYGDYLPAKDLLNLLDPDDVRWGMFLFDDDLVGKYASYRVNKWPTTTNEDNVSVIRLSEVYLNRAEARARSGNDVAGAQADLNLIRQRALATAPDITLTGSALLDEILLERRRELCYEGHRLFDITRHKQDLVRVDVTGDVSFYAYPGDYFIFPIPYPEMDLNPNITQNPGY